MNEDERILYRFVPHSHRPINFNKGPNNYGYVPYFNIFVSRAYKYE